MPRPPWPAEHDRYLREHRDDALADVARALGRSLDSVKQRRHMLGLSQPATKHAKTCVVCGRAFACPSSDKTITCSAECSAERAHQSRRGHAWTEMARARLATEGQTANLQLGTPAARESPLAGPFATNQEAKIWWVEHLGSGRRWPRTSNLALWCRTHEHLFSGDDWQHAYAGLRQVQSWLMGRRKTARRWKGWTLYRAARYKTASAGARAMGMKRGELT